MLKRADIVKYLQGDSRWRKKIYSATGNKAQTMSASGCGPTAAAIAIATFCDKTVNPWTVALWFMQKGYRTKNSGTAWGAFKWIATKYKGKGIKNFWRGKNKAKLKKALDMDALVVCSMGPGYWTKGGHYIVVYAYDDQYIYAVDPATNKRKKQAIAPFIKQCKQMFAFFPG